MGFSLLYSVAIGLLLAGFFPYFLYQIVWKGKYRESFLRRLGYGFPHIDKRGPIVWIHAVSVGETQAVSLLAQRLQEEIPNVRLVVSSTTETGHREAKRILPLAAFHLFLPYDLGFCVRRAIRRAPPDLVLVAESDVWYRFLSEAKKAGAVTLVVNGKISERSCQRFAWVPFFARRLFSPVDAFCLQSELFRKRFHALGVPSAKMSVTGNLKGDVVVPVPTREEREAKRRELGISADDFVVVIGSTHAPEERELLDALSPLIATSSQVKVLVVPRHPERFAEVGRLLAEQGVPSGSWSGGAPPGWQLLLVDAMGQLRTLYALADVAIVAGSFIQKVGGHNILEPMSLGVPTLCGPYMHSQPALLETALFWQAVIQLPAAEMGRAIEALRLDCARRRQLAEQGRKMSESMRGATERTLEVARILAPQLFSGRFPDSACEKFTTII